MSCEFICDGCGERAPALAGDHSYHKPSHWYQRSDDDGIQVACSRACIDKVAERSGKTGLVLPV